MLVVISIALMAFDYQQPKARYLHYALDVLITPIQYIINFPIRLLDAATNGISTQRKLLNENADLRAQQFLLQAQVQKLLSLEQENAQLRALLESSPKMSERMLVGQVLAIPPDRFTQEVIVDQGQKAGIYIGQPVFDALGVMGQVIQVGLLTSRVLLLSDSRSALPVYNTRNDILAIAAGSGKNRLNLLYIPQTADVKVGDLFMTSGLDLRYPRGYPVGVVIEVKHNPGEPFSAITLQPNAHLDRSHQVLLIWPVNAEGIAEAQASLASTPQGTPP